MLLYSEEYTKDHVIRLLENEDVSLSQVFVSSEGMSEAGAYHSPYIFDLAVPPADGEWKHAWLLAQSADVYVLLQCPKEGVLRSTRTLMEVADNVWRLERIGNVISQYEMKARGHIPAGLLTRQWVLEDRHLTLQTPTKQVTP